MDDKITLLQALVELSWRASEKVLSFYNNTIEVTSKEDGSPLTKADLASHHLLCDGLRKLTPNINIISEESGTETPMHALHETFWLVDPLDGTKEFINKNGEFTTNIALIEKQMPTLGVVCAPALGILYAGVVGGPAFKETKDKTRTPLALNYNVEKGLIVVGSRSHGNPSEMEAFLKGKKVNKFIATGSSLKFCRIAEGKAHIYPRLGRTMEWDTAAGHAVLQAAGGKVTKMDNSPLRYGKPGLDNPHFIGKAAY